jgi:hypothetical protein
LRLFFLKKNGSRGDRPRELAPRLPPELCITLGPELAVKLLRNSQIQFELLSSDNLDKMPRTEHPRA